MPSETSSEAFIGPRRPVYILSYGMGVESHAILERWIHEPWTRPFDDWSQLIVITAQVGEEHKADTIPNVERRTLPLLRQLGVRFVEVARRGALEADGIVVLQDTREPFRLNPDGAYKLSDELLSNGTIPQQAGVHKCAQKFKAWVITQWLAYAFRGETDKPVFHVFGYNADEASRVAVSEESIAGDNRERGISVQNRAPILVFGFNSEEVSRIERNREYDGPERTGMYPLQEWGWRREKCWEYIFERCGIDWKKSHCSFCPFCAEASKGLAGAVSRWFATPEQTAHGLVVEYNALCFNPRGLLYKTRSLMSVVKRHGVTPVLAEFDRRMKASRWGYYRVRRIYTKKGQAIRCVERLAAGTRDEMSARFDAESAANSSLEIDTMHEIRYAMFQRRVKDVYPSAEGFFVVAPLFVGTKVRGKIEKFEERWQNMLQTGKLSNEDDDAQYDVGQQELPMEVAA